MELVAFILAFFAVPTALVVLCLTIFKLPEIPGPGISEYFPGGVVYPIFKDSRVFSRILSSLSEKYGDVYQVRLGPALTVVSSVPEDMLQILTNTDAFVRPDAIMAVFTTLVPGGLFTMTGALHRETRKSLRSNFNHAMLESFHSHMVDAVRELCDALTGFAEDTSVGGTSNVVDISEQLAVTTFRVILNVAFGFGMTREERLEFAEIVDVLVDEMMKDFVQHPIRHYLEVFGSRKTLIECKTRITEICKRFIQERLKDSNGDKAAQHGDILDAILALEDVDPVATASMAVEFALAGSHTTNQVLAWCIYDICCNPLVREKIEQELADVLGDQALSEPITCEDMKRLSYIARCWKETLRRHPIGGGIIRKTTKNVTLKGSGTCIPKGTRVMAQTSRTMTHEGIWRDPQTYNPDRFGSTSDPREGDRVLPGANLPFGAGPKSCAGRFLADYEGPLLLAELHRRFRFTLACDPNEVVNCSCFVDTPKSATKKGGALDMGVPVRVRLRSMP